MKERENGEGTRDGIHESDGVSGGWWGCGNLNLYLCE